MPQVMQPKNKIDIAGHNGMVDSAIERVTATVGFSPEGA
jgi:hypothetical protein